MATVRREYKGRNYVGHYLRRGYREKGEVKQRTLANLSDLPEEVVELIRLRLKGVDFVTAKEGFEIVRSLPHGHVAAVRAMLRSLGVHELIQSRPSRLRNLCEALIVSRIVASRSKLATHGWFKTNTLAEDLSVAEVGLDQIYEALDYLEARRHAIEKRLAKRHLGESALVLYDLTSVAYEGVTCELAAHGGGKSGRKGKREIRFGLVTDLAGRPIASEVYPGNTADPMTLQDQIEKLKHRFGVKRVIMIGDRGVMTQARVQELEAKGGIDWITALRAPAIRRLRKRKTLQPSLFDERDLGEITSPDYPGERLVACRNPLLAAERTATRESLIAATEKQLEALRRRVEKGRLKDRDKIAITLGKMINKYKVAKHFHVEIGEAHFQFARKHDSISEEAALDGIYVLRTSARQDELAKEQVVTSYKQLSLAEQAFRIYKSIDLQVAPIRHRLAGRVRAHVFLCTLAYYVEWHLRQAWAPYLFEDERPGRAGDSPVSSAERSKPAKAKAASKKAEDGFPSYDFKTLLDHLSTVTRNVTRIPALPQAPPFTVTTTPNAYQQRLFELVGLSNLS